MKVSAAPVAAAAAAADDVRVSSAARGSAGATLQLRFPNPVLAIAIIVGMWITVALGADYNTHRHELVKVIRDTCFCCEPVNAALKWVDGNVNDKLLGANKGVVIGVIAVAAVAIHVGEAVAALFVALRAQSKFGAAVVPTTHVAFYALSVLTWGFGSFSILLSQLRRLEKTH